MNFGATAVDLARWRLADSVGSRHAFGPSVLGPARALIVYRDRGRARRGIDAGFSRLAGIAGLGLNNDVVALLYNAASSLVAGGVFGRLAGDGGTSARKS